MNAAEEKGKIKTDKLPVISLEKISNQVSDLPEGCYQVTLIKVTMAYIKGRGIPYLAWCWEIVDEIDGTLLEGRRIISFTGIGSKDSEPLMNLALKRHIEALGVKPHQQRHLITFKYHMVTLDIEGDHFPIVRMMPEWYYQMPPIPRTDEWIIPGIQDV